ncbi:MAG TPA: MaoC/PaaZ C-terminal domain-containing protein [Nocardioidaceae bacterium]|nr:MaoC/PaaZ C-terminal domain-containing protein [Nocardioidaceae bacterium]
MATEPTTREVTGRPGTLPLLLKAALPAIPGVSSLPGVRRSGHDLPRITLTRHDVPVDRAHVAAYSEICGFPLRENVPLTYLHMLAFPLHMTIMTDSAFPFPAIGTVHLENSITQHRPVTASESLQVTARPQALRSHPKGKAFDIVTEVHSAGELVWEEISTFLRRGRSDGEAADTGMQLEEVPSSGIEWRLAGDLGRRYASVSGDHNPIHLYGVTAKAFGFPRQIAHGMWSKARCVAMLEPRLPDAVRVDVAFKKPVLLPGTVAFGSKQLPATRGRSGDWAFSLTNPKDGAPHLLGRTTAL